METCTRWLRPGSALNGFSSMFGPSYNRACSLYYCIFDGNEYHLTGMPRSLLLAGIRMILVKGVSLLEDSFKGVTLLLSP